MKLGPRDIVTLLKVFEFQGQECDLVHQSDSVQANVRLLLCCFYVTQSLPYWFLQVRTTSLKAKQFQPQYQQQQYKAQQQKGLQLIMFRSVAGEKEQRSVAFDEAECMIVAQFLRESLRLSLGFPH